MTVQADRLNFLRFISHFRAVHRGASVAGLRTTSVRKLLPEYVCVSLSLCFSTTVMFINCTLSYTHTHTHTLTHSLIYCVDHGVSYALSIPLMESHVDCSTI